MSLVHTCGNEREKENPRHGLGFLTPQGSMEDVACNIIQAAIKNCPVFGDGDRQITISGAFFFSP